MVLARNTDISWSSHGTTHTHVRHDIYSDK